MDDNLKAILKRMEANADAAAESVRDRIKLWREHRAPASAGTKWRSRRETWIAIAFLCAGILYEAAHH
jgi:hypothetical protein